MPISGDQGKIMNDKLKKLFDYQRFANNKRLSALINKAESSGGQSLSDDDLEFVNAAGDIDLMHLDEEKYDGNA